MAKPGGTLARLDFRVIGGFLCILLYALPVFLPPGPTPLTPPEADATLWERLFPDVPGWWVAARLVALFTGTLLFAHWAVVPALRLSRKNDTAVAPSQSALGTACSIAAVHVIASMFAEHLPRWGQSAYVLLLAAPGTVVWLTTGRTLRRPWRRRKPSKEAWICAGLVSLWIPWRFLAVWHDPRVASLGDFWFLYESYADFIANGTNFLTAWQQPLVAGIGMVAAGGGLIEPGRLPRVQALQTMGVLWIGLAAALTSWSTSRLVSRRAAPVAAAGVLFSPMALSVSHWPYPFGFVLALAALLMALLVQFSQRRSIAAFLLLGSVAGLTVTQGYAAFSAPPAVLAALWLATRAPRLPTMAFATFVLSFAAPILPAMPTIDFNSFQEEIIGTTWRWSDVETYTFDQRDLPPLNPQTYEALATVGKRGPLDTVIGGVLAPFASPRTAIRLFGDALLEPWSAALTLMGLLLCLRMGRRRRVYWLFAAAWLFVQLPVMATTNYDRISPTRNLALPVISMPFAALAFEALCANLAVAGGATVGLFAVLLCAVSGTVLHDWVNPLRLSTSTMEIIVEAIAENRPEDGAVALSMLPGTAHQFPIHDQGIASSLIPPLPLVGYGFARHLIRPETEATPIAGAILWSPGLEERCHISRAVCDLWPGSVIYILESRSRLSRAFAASPSAPNPWKPALPAGRWSGFECAAFPDPFPGAAERQWCSPDYPSTGNVRLTFLLLGGPALHDGKLGDASATLETLFDTLVHARASEPLTALRVRALNALGAVRALQGSLARAQELFTQALALAPSYAAAENNLGVVLLLRGEQDAAREHLRKALTQEPPQAAAYYNYALAAVLSGEKGEALDHLERADELLPAPTRLGEAGRRGLAEARLDRSRLLPVLSPREDYFSIDFHLALRPGGS
jgi:hypothetical protein